MQSWLWKHPSLLEGLSQSYLNLGQGGHVCEPEFYGEWLQAMDQDASYFQKWLFAFCYLPGASRSLGMLQYLMIKFGLFGIL